MVPCATERTLVRSAPRLASARVNSGCLSENAASQTAATKAVGATQCRP